MKKLFLAVCAFCAFTAVSAKSILEIVPAAAVGNELTLEFKIENDGTCTGAQANFYLPEGSVLGEFEAGDAMDDHRYSIKTVTTANLQKAGYTLYQIVVTTATKALLLSDNLGQVTVTLPSDAAGVYEIPMAKILTTTTGATSNRGNYSVGSSFYTVGDVTGESLSLEGTVSGRVLDAIAEVKGLAKVDLSKVTEFTNTFTYVDGVEVVAPTADITANVQYKGNKAGYYSVNVPFAGEVVGTVGKFDKVEDGYAKFSEVTSVEAGSTVLASGDVTVSASGVKIANVETVSNAEGCYVLDGKFYHGTGLTVKPMRGLFEGASLSNLRIAFEGVTGINAAEIDAQAGNTYDLQGRQTTNAKNGVFVVNGKKQFVK